jgi:hypothetical protein
MSEDQDSKPTVELPKVDPNVELMKLVKEGQARTDANFDLMHVQFDGLSGRVTELEAARGRQSNRVKSVEQTASQNDLAQEARLAQEIAAREALAKKASELEAKVDDLTAINQAQVAALVQLEKHATALLGNKKVRIAGYALLLIVIAVAAKFGIHIEVPK